MAYQELEARHFGLGSEWQRITPENYEEILIRSSQDYEFRCITYGKNIRVMVKEMSNAIVPLSYLAAEQDTDSKKTTRAYLRRVK